MISYDKRRHEEMNIVEVAVYLWIYKVVNKSVDSSLIKVNPAVVEWASLFSVLNLQLFV
jgi:hypothetical protein